MAARGRGVTRPQRGELAPELIANALAAIQMYRSVSDTCTLPPEAQQLLGEVEDRLLHALVLLDAIAAAESPQLPRSGLKPGIRPWQR